jgi:hypothetical protein
VDTEHILRPHPSDLIFRREGQTTIAETSHLTHKKEARFVLSNENYS